MVLKRFLLILGLFLPVLCEAESSSWLRTTDSCTEFVSPEATRICERIIRSREYLDEAHPALIADKSGRAVSREVVIIAWDVFDLPHRIWLTMPVRPKRGEVFAVTVKTAGYKVERVRGTGPYKLEFRVTKADEANELKVYGAKYVWIPNKYSNEWSHKTLSKVAEEKQYLPFQDHLYHPELVERGLKYLESMVDAARDELGTVPSRAFPGWVLRDVYPSEMVLNLIVSEHTDPFKLFDETVVVGLPRSLYLLGVLIEMAIHGPATYAHLCSHANACGWTQFTNKSVGVYPGTYTHTYNKCRAFDGRAVIDRDFTLGTKDPHNALKAAICYLDIENAALPSEAKAEYLRDPKHGSIYMLTAYNAGGGWSKKVFENITSFRKKSGNSTAIFDHQSIPKMLFQRGTFYNHETHWYIRKYLWVWQLLFEDRRIVVPATQMSWTYE